MGPNRLVLNGSSNYLDLGPSINSNSSFSFETWIRPQSPTTYGSVILTNINSLFKGFTLSQSNFDSGYLDPAFNATGASYTEQVLVDNPTLYWKLDETSGTTINDVSGNGNTGTYYPGSGIISYSQPGLLNGSTYGVKFPGSNATAYTNASFSNPSPATIEIWFSTTSTDGGTIAGLSDSQTGSPYSFDRILYMDSSGVIRFGTNHNGFFVITSSDTYNDGRSHHLVALVYPSEGLGLFIDGKEIGNIPNGLVQNFTGFWRIGGVTGGVYPDNPSNGYINATLDEFAIYPSTLSASRIQAHYQAGKACHTMSPLYSNTWNHIAGTFESSSGQASFYLNGNSQCTQTYLGLTVSGSTSNMIFGSDTTQNNFWAGSLGSFKTYSSALPIGAIQQNYAATAAQFDIQQIGVPAPIMWFKSG